MVLAWERNQPGRAHQDNENEAYVYAAPIWIHGVDSLLRKMRPTH
jgi:hypothetical protein